VVLLAILIAPSMARSKYVNAETKTVPGVTINLYYLNPLMSLAEVTDTPDHFWSDMPLAFGRTPIWRGGIVCWLFVGGISLLAMLPFVKKISSGEPVQYEDLAARM
jgi:hypothetical protein